MGGVEFEPGAMAKLRELTLQSSTAASVFMLLLEWARPRSCTVEVTYVVLAREMQCSRATIGRAMQLLREHEWVVSKGSSHRLQRVRFTRAKHPDDPVIPTALYRHYSEAGELLYVGISKSAPQRLAQHMAGSKWAREIARVEIDHLPSREEALAAEEKAIRTEKPLWNTVHNNSHRLETIRSRDKSRPKRKASPVDDIMPSQAYLDHLDRLTQPEHEAALVDVRRWVRFCPYPEWVLLELPEGQWGALWFQGYGTEYTDMVLQGDYSLLAIVTDTRAEVMRYMANNLMFPAEHHADMIALQQSTA